MGPRPLALPLSEAFSDHPEAHKLYDQAVKLIDPARPPEGPNQSTNPPYHAPPRGKKCGKVRKSAEKCGKVRKKIKKTKTTKAAHLSFVDLPQISLPTVPALCHPARASAARQDPLREPELRPTAQRAAAPRTAPKFRFSRAERGTHLPQRGSIYQPRARPAGA